MPKQTFIALLRGINVGGNNPVPMAELRVVCEELGFENVRTYIQSGNVIFTSTLPSARVETDLEAAIAKRFGLTIAVVVRTAKQWEGLVEANPFLAACESEPNRVMLGLSKVKPNADTESELQKRVVNEVVSVIDEGIWIHFKAGAGSSKLTPAALDRAAGSPVTMRNWRTVLKLREMAGG